MKSDGYSDYDIRFQSSRKYLIEHPSRFKLKPDIMLSKGGETIIMDTKWKMLHKSMHNFGISQSDIYQMYAYGKKYDAKRVMLLYPLNENVKDIEREKLIFRCDSELELEIRFVDLDVLDDETIPAKIGLDIEDIKKLRKYEQ